MAERTCSIEGCNRKHRARGWCIVHYTRWKNNGDPLTSRNSQSERRVRSCLVDECPVEHYARGHCRVHYRRWMKRRRTDLITFEERFWSKVDVGHPLGCWEWTDGCDRNGYGRLSHNNKTGFAHRVSYEALMGRIPDGLGLDHLCRNRRCVNPDHLEPVTQAENLRRAPRPKRTQGAHR